MTHSVEEPTEAQLRHFKDYVGIEDNGGIPAVPDMVASSVNYDIGFLTDEFRASNIDLVVYGDDGRRGRVAENIAKALVRSRELAERQTHSALDTQNRLNIGRRLFGRLFTNS